MLSVILLVIVIAALAVLAAVVLVASGRGGDMPATEVGGYAPLDLGPVSATDVVLLRPPTGLWGYNQQATDEALERIAESIRERDVRIVALEQLVTDLTQAPAAPMPAGSPYPGARLAYGDVPYAAGGAGGQTAPIARPLAENPEDTEDPDGPDEGDEAQSGLDALGFGMQAAEPLGAPVGDLQDGSAGDFASWYRPEAALWDQETAPTDEETGRASHPSEPGEDSSPEVSHD